MFVYNSVLGKYHVYRYYRKFVYLFGCLRF